jgi:manganese efflux pump family protein
MDAEGTRGGFSVTELFAAGITTIDIIIVYALLHVKKGKLKLAVWTAFLNLAFPFLGFVVGEMTASLFMEWSGLLSGVMLGLIGLHMLLHDDSDAQNKLVSPYLIAVAVSIDAFSVSVSFGMLHFDKVLFIAATGLFSLVFSYAVLLFKSRLRIKNGRVLKAFAGVAFLVMGIMSCFS